MKKKENQFAYMKTVCRLNDCHHHVMLSCSDIQKNKHSEYMMCGLNAVVLKNMNKKNVGDLI